MAEQLKDIVEQFLHEPDVNPAEQINHSLAERSQTKNGARTPPVEDNVDFF